MLINYKSRKALEDVADFSMRADNSIVSNRAENIAVLLFCVYLKLTTL